MMKLDTETLMEVRSNSTLANHSASALVAAALRREVLHGTVAGGERLRQDAIATRFGVSQMVVREAFKELVAEGFLRLEPRRGVSVAMLTVEEAAEITQLRGLIEPQALEWAIPRMTAEDFDIAAGVLSKLNKARSVDQVISLNAHFHDTLYAPARQQRTLALVAALRLGFERYLRFTWEETSHLPRSQEEHQELLKLCKARKTRAARILLKQHILATGELLTERLKGRNAEDRQRDTRRGPSRKGGTSTQLLSA